MHSYAPVVTEIGTLTGRDAIYLDSVTVADHPTELKLCGEFSCSLASKPTPAEWQAFQIRFLEVIAFQMVELDTWESLQRGLWPQSSFDEIKNSSWLAGMGGKKTMDHKHFVFLTYDQVFEVICKGYELEMKASRP